jgi:hypothetical protein
MVARGHGYDRSWELGRGLTQLDDLEPRVLLDERDAVVHRTGMAVRAR